MRVFWYLVMQLSFLGFVLSAIIHFFALHGAPLSLALYILQLGLFFILMLPSVFRRGAHYRQLGAPRDWEEFQRGCPRPVKIFSYGLAIYAGLNIVLWMLRFQTIGGVTFRRFAPDPFSAFWMYGYFMLAIYYYLAAHPPAPAITRVCPQGHALPSGTLACAQCARPVVPPSPPQQAPTPPAVALDLPRPLKRGVLYLIMGAGEFGFVLSLIVYGAALLAIPIPEAVMALHKGLFFIWLPAVLVIGSTLPPQARRRRRWNTAIKTPAVFEPTPEWMRWLAGGLYANFVLNMAVLMVNSPPRGAPRGAGPLPYHLFASGWMVFYYVALLASYAALHRLSSTAGQLCPHGQDVSPAGPGCAACGLRVPADPDA